MSVETTPRTISRTALVSFAGALLVIVGVFAFAGTNFNATDADAETSMYTLAGFNVVRHYKCIFPTCTNFWCDANCNHHPRYCPASFCRALPVPAPPRTPAPTPEPTVKVTPAPTEATCAPGEPCYTHWDDISVLPAGCPGAVDGASSESLVGTKVPDDLVATCCTGNLAAGTFPPSPGGTTCSPHPIGGSGPLSVRNYWGCDDGVSTFGEGCRPLSTQFSLAHAGQAGYYPFSSSLSSEYANNDNVTACNCNGDVGLLPAGVVSIYSGAGCYVAIPDGSAQVAYINFPKVPGCSTPAPTEPPTEPPTHAAEPVLTATPTAKPTDSPTPKPTPEPTAKPTEQPTDSPTPQPTAEPTCAVTNAWELIMAKNNGSNYWGKDSCHPIVCLGINKGWKDITTKELTETPVTADQCTNCFCFGCQTSQFQQNCGGVAPTEAACTSTGCCPTSCLGGLANVRKSKCNACECAGCAPALFGNNCNGPDAVLPEPCS